MGKAGFVAVIISVIITEILSDIPGCDYFDTVDLTNSLRLSDGSYQYENAIIPKGKTGQYNYQILREGKVAAVAEHTRGCVCQLKSCVRFCCGPQQMLVDNERMCYEETKIYNPLLNVTLNNGTEVEVNALHEFVVQQDFAVPCQEHIHLDADNNIDHKWTLYENGILYIHNYQKNFGKMEYCLQPQRLDDDTYKIVPHLCDTPTDRTFVYIQCASVFCMILTIAIHLYTPELRDNHYKCSTCYFTCLTLSFILLRIEIIVHSSSPSKINCCAFAYVGYYVVMATFLWLLIINYNLWKKFKTSGRSKACFTKNNIFVWTIAAVLLLITWLIDHFNNLEEEDPPEVALWKPGFCVYSCWISTETWSAMIYYHGPMLILLLFNITFFTSTAWKLYVDSKDIKKQWNQAEAQQKIKGRANFVQFFQYFIIAGLIWTLEIVSYLMREYSLSWIECITSSQGIIIFVVTVLKKDVRKILYTRIARR